MDELCIYKMDVCEFSFYADFKFFHPALCSF